MTSQMNSTHNPWMAAWNNTQVDYPLDRCVNELVEEQAQRTPDAIAVSTEDQHLTYQELDQRANQLAHYLQTLGVGPEVLVGVYIERSLEMVIGLLGILKAGGAYVPLDPSYPPERIAFILDDAQVSVILTQATLAKNLTSYPAQVVCLDSYWNAIAHYSSEPLGRTAIASNLMYVIYTSGSTGQPKGVMIPHSGICNQLCWRQTTFPLTASDRVLQNISFSFDPSVWQIFWPLSSGAQLVLPRPGGHKDINYLIHLIAAQHITVIALVPSMLRVLLEDRDLNYCCQSLKHIFCGGEALQRDIQESYFSRLKTGTVLHNVYGPTEASIDATFWTCQPNSHHLIAPIGHPIANVQAYILDYNLNPVPIGEPGELYIGGAGLARGYLNRPELTEERFIPHPFSTEVNARLYKTGDLVRYLEDGNIEFLGRVDHQVKVRGFRIELGEIEATLNQFPGIQQSLAMVREDIPGDQRLVAYCVCPQSSRPNAKDIRAFVGDKLPDYMVPAAFVCLDQLPLNPNGKVDRRALPAPVLDRLVDQTSVAPQDHLECQLVEIWESILNLQPIGVQDNFFELGGNSLLALRTLTKIESVLNRKIALDIFFLRPTIAEFATYLRTSDDDSHGDTIIPLKLRPTNNSLFCIYGVSVYYELAQALSADYSVYGMYLQDEVDILQIGQLSQTRIPTMQVKDLASRYIQKLRSIQPQGPYHLAGLSFGGLIAFEMAHQLLQDGEIVETLILFDTPAPEMDIRRPLYRQIISYFKTIYNNMLISLIDHLFLRLKFQVSPLASFLKCVNSQYLEQLFLSWEKLAKLLLRSKLVLKAMRAYAVCPYPGKVLVCRAVDQYAYRTLPPYPETDPACWDKHILGEFNLYDIPGDHLSILREPNVHYLAAKLNTHMESSALPNSP